MSERICHFYPLTLPGRLFVILVTCYSGDIAAEFLKTLDHYYVWLFKQLLLF